MKSLFLILSLITTQCLWAGSTVLTFDSYKDIEKLINEEVNDETIVVFDIDDTLLHAPNCLPGGGQNIPSFRRWKVILEQCPYFPTEDLVVDIIADLQRDGIATMALTARGGDLIDLTQEHLDTLGIDFNGMPFDSSFDFTEQVTTKKKLYFRSGVAWASGTSKGKALRLFQTKVYPTPYKKIIFLDDNKKNINSVASQFRKDTDVEVFSVHYTRFDH